MRQLLQLIIFSVLLLPACRRTPAEMQPSLMEASRQELASALSERDELLKLVTEISRLMAEIKRVENILTSPASNENTRRQLISDLKALQEKLDSRRHELTDLDTRLRESSLVTEDMTAAIQSLYHEIDMQSATVRQLNRRLSEANATIESLHQEVDSLNSQIEVSCIERDEAVANSDSLEKQLNRCYYVVASRKELKEHHILESSFLRKTRIMEDDFDMDCFTQADKTSLVVIPLPSDKSKILSKHPKKSYEIVNHDGKGKLLILNQTCFWCLSNYLVVQTD